VIRPTEALSFGEREPIAVPTYRTRSIPTITCPHCRTTFAARVTQHGLIRCGKCGKTMRI